MIRNLESNYDCSQAGDDLHQLQEELLAAQAENNSPEAMERVRRLENQIHFIKTKCDIHP
ncbi:DUF2524 domain-containing protein [Paenibacillus filicis]|uniref:DUF2524 domain-containing protein n=1 Tax=Paenibacillus gyeongsangnamensis TaxID=3388067 RepID=A0ABT4Q7I5_9BACL|nr:DUF2524 domain-containing protein [Paenibacillus filicis]MCZ8512840.1 DUF2524 domain-containing protein [Paenibacillus filicis]